MDWIYDNVWQIASGVLGAGTITGWIAAIRWRRHDGSNKDIDVVNNVLDTIKNYAVAIDRQSESNGALLAAKQKSDALYLEMQTKYIELHHEIGQLKYQQDENVRKINGLTRQMKTQVGYKLHAERNICFVRDCQLRKPDFGTYSSANPDIDGDGHPDKFE